NHPTIPSACQRFNVVGAVGGVPQSLPQPVNRGANAVLVLHEGVVRPELLANILPRQHFAGALKQHGKDLERLLREAEGRPTVRMKSPGPGIELKPPEPAQPMGAIEL